MLSTIKDYVNVRVKKIRNYYHNRNTYRVVFHANDGYTTGPFLHGAQLLYRQFGNYIFIENSRENNKLLKDRNFKDFKEVVLKDKKVDLSTLEDDLLSMSEIVLYNKDYNLITVMIPVNAWSTLNTALNIVEDLDVSLDIKKDVVLNIISELNKQTFTEI